MGLPHTYPHILGKDLTPESGPIPLESTSPTLDLQLFASSGSTPTADIYDEHTIELLDQLLQAKLCSSAFAATYTEAPTLPS